MEESLLWAQKELFVEVVEALDFFLWSASYS